MRKRGAQRLKAHVDYCSSTRKGEGVPGIVAWPMNVPVLDPTTIPREDVRRPTAAEAFLR